MMHESQTSQRCDWSRSGSEAGGQAANVPLAGATMSRVRVCVPPRHKRGQADQADHGVTRQAELVGRQQDTSASSQPEHWFATERRPAA
jgi:hypothetical protein